jgi:hypothetical protein
MAGVSDHKQQRRFRAAVLLMATLSLLLLLLVAHPADHHSFTVVGFILIPVFLFGHIIVEDTVWPTNVESDRRHFLILARPSLFQRPPPSIS